jgi:uncharacterized protein
VIIYQATKGEFLDDSFKRDIEAVVTESYARRTGGKVSASEVRSWKESLMQMAKALNDDEIPKDAGVAIEYRIPATAKRVDFILTGLGADQGARVIIVELKQWSEAKRTEKDGIVAARRGGQAGEVEGPHPSYQAWSYAMLLEGFNEAVYDGGMSLQPCAYLHNYPRDNVIDHVFYAPYIEKAPLFLKGDDERARLQRFIKQHVKHGDSKNLIYKIESGRIRPSKMLADSLVKMLDGAPEFVLVDDQKLVYETAIAAARGASDTKKHVVLVKGGPGTGKSVVAINLLVALTKLGLFCKYVSKNAAPRAVYEIKLKGTKTRTEISNLFSGSGAFTDTEANSFGALIVDEAHRLNEKSGLYGNLGENQVKEILSAAKCAVVFVDDDQQVTLLDIGHSEEILKWAKALNAQVTELELASQFRCNGSDGYLAWLDNTLGIRPTANELLGADEFDFRVMDSPQAVHDLITEKNRANNKSRVVAGYCWKWPSKKQRAAFDIEIPEHGYRKRWNVTDGPSPWIIGPGSIDEVGCIHTCQGLELDYVGVIVGPDLVVRNGEVVCRPEQRASSDRSIRGYKEVLKRDPVAGKARLDRIIKNTYRTLMTRGMKGCYVYCTDAETAEYFKSRLAIPQPAAGTAAHAKVLPFRKLPQGEMKPYLNALPVIDLKFAAGAFGDSQVFDPSDAQWVAIPDGVKPEQGLFIAQVIGESMNRRIPNGTWCVFRANPAGSKQGKVVVAQHRSIHDVDLGGSYTVKVYQSEKAVGDDGAWHHGRIVLKPDTNSPGYAPIVIEGEELEGLAIVAEVIKTLG